MASALLELPAELIYHIFTYLSPVELSIASRTCHTFNTISREERLWHAFVNDELPQPIHASTPSPTFRDLYIAHHPHWFLTRNKIWFGDNEPNGKLLLARYDEERGSIVAHTITAVRGVHTLKFWEQNRDVIIHSFDPVISLDLNQPVLRLDMNNQGQDNGDPSERSYAASSIYSRELLMPIFPDPGLYGSFMLCRALPTAAIGPQTQVWPPLRFPSLSRTRNDSNDNFNSAGHRPTILNEVSQESFRLHKWVEYTGRRVGAPTLSSLEASLSTLSGLAGGLGFSSPFFRAGPVHHRFPESITTYATLPESCYTPTKEKPWQGIWCGDYSGHGCEFLVITQPDKKDEKPLPDNMHWLREWLRGGRRVSTSSSGSFASALEDLEFLRSSVSEVSDDDAVMVEMPSSTGDSVSDGVDGPSGRIEAIKLTGDTNIPRGEYTFIAPDIGQAGFVRIADEEGFRGARIVRSAGHIAGRGFREAQWTPSQLIMVSHDRLAQFWEGFGHISFYQRVDIGALSKLS